MFQFFQVDLNEIGQEILVFNDFDFKMRIKRVNGKSELSLDSVYSSGTMKIALIHLKT